MVKSGWPAASSATVTVPVGTPGTVAMKSVWIPRAAASARPLRPRSSSPTALTKATLWPRRRAWTARLKGAPPKWALPSIRSQRISPIERRFTVIVCAMQMHQASGINSTLIRSTAAAALGGLLFGFDTAVISGTTRALTDVYALTPGMLGVTVSSALAGTVVGSALAAEPADRYGRKASLGLLAVLYMLTSIGCAVAWNLH